MSIRRHVDMRLCAVALSAVALSAGAVALTHRIARAGQNPIVVERFLLGYTDRKGHFIPTAGRGATNVDRNAIAMFVFSGPVDMGPRLRASLPLTLAEQKILEDKIKADPDYNPARDGYEPGVIPRRRADDRSGYYVATGSVNQFSVAVTTAGAGGTTQAPGQFFQYLKPGTTRVMTNRLLFNPRYTVATYSKPGEVDYNPTAFDSNTEYTVTLDGGKTPTNAFNTVRNVDGETLGAKFVTTFTTTSRYVQDFNRPEVKSLSPGDETVGVAYDADIDIEFDEPMDVASFVTPRFQGDDQWTINVAYSANTQLNGTLAGRNVLGVVRVKPQTGGNVIQFRPLQGFGKGPYEVEVVVTNGVTDLSGNNILRQFQFSFRTERNTNAEDFGTVDETFDTTAKRDATFVPSGDYAPALWNAVGNRGQLTATVGEVTFNVEGPNASGASGTGVNIWFSSPIRFQLLYPASAMGGRPRTLRGFSWATGVYVGRSYPSSSIQLGHANAAVDAGGFPTTGPSNLNFGDTPVTVVSNATYNTTTTSVNGIWVKGPDFIKTFNYDGTHGMILDMSHNGDPASAGGTFERWRIDNAYPINVLSALIGTGIVTQPWFCSTQFNYLTPGAEAQSTFYDVGRGNARLLPQQLVPITQPQGTSVNFLWQGAKEDALNPLIPDTSTLTGWVSDIRQLSNYRYVRFRATLLNNTVAGTAPTVDTLTIPFVFR